MPGLVGFADSGHFSDRDNVLRNMQKLITHEKQQMDCLFADDFVRASRSGLGTVNKETQPYERNGIWMWLDGEFYNQESLLPLIENCQESSDMAILYHLYNQNVGFGFLDKIDGHYNAVIYDSNKQKVHIFSDRLGMKQLYWTRQNGCFAWSAEVKAFLALPGFKPVIDPQAVKEFFEVGYLMELRTWFEGVSLIPSGTVITWDIAAAEMTMFRYWWWDRIKPENLHITENEAIDEFARLLKNAVAKRSSGNHRTGIFLSGGLDSRAILAAFPEADYPVQALTYGQKGSPDIEIARIVAKVNNVEHHVIDLNRENWIDGRIQNIWRSDGQFSFYHMHSLIAYQNAVDHFAVNLDGIGGSSLKGSYVNKIKIHQKQPINKAMAADYIQLSGYMNCSPKIIGALDNYVGLPKTEYFLVQNRQRRFIGEGIRQGENFLHHRMPFLDNDLIEFIFTLPDWMRENGHIHQKMLMRNFPEYYQTIAEQHSGIPISRSHFAHQVNGFQLTMKNKIIRNINKGRYPNYNQFCNYPEWIKNDPAKALVEEILFSKKALYREYLSADHAAEEWRSHFQGNDCAQKICLYLTFEIWLQQVFNKKFIGGL